MRVFACMASTLDGKIGPAGVDHFVSISSPVDQQHLKAIRDQADGILFGASTYRAWPKAHTGLKGVKKAHHFIMSRRLDLDVNTPLFQSKDTPITVFKVSGGHVRPEHFPERVEIVGFPEDPGQIFSILNHIKESGVTSLLIEGGGRVLNQFIEAGVLQELYLTIVPAFMGNPDAPGLLGDLKLSNKPRLQLQSSKLVADETFQHFRLDYS